MAAWKSRVLVRNYLLISDPNPILKDIQLACKQNHLLASKVAHQSRTSKYRHAVLKGNSAL